MESNMKKSFILVGMVIVCLLFLSCSSSHSSNDSDIIPDFDNSETVTDNDTDSEEDSDFIDDSDEADDTDSAPEEPDETEEDEEYTEDIDWAACYEDYRKEIPDKPLFDELPSIWDRYKRCYDEIPDDPYEGFFADKNIESQIKKSLGYDEDYELKTEDLEKVAEIVVFSKDLRGFEKLVNLEYVKFQDTEGNIYDFTPLANLKKLKKIRIYFRPPEELSPTEDHENMTCLDGSFSLLTTLETLEIENTHLKEIDPIEQLVNLKTLEIDHNMIMLLPENMGNLQKLEKFTFSHNNVKDINPIFSLTNLEVLVFTDNQIEDISAIRNMTKLSVITFLNNKVKDISAIKKLCKLKSLGASYNKIEILPEFECFGVLQYIYLSFNNITNIPEMEGLDSLIEMWLDNNKLDDENLTKLDTLEHVSFLDVALNKITKVPIMKNLKSLKELYLNYNYITDLSGFADNESFPALKRLDVGSNNISDVEAFRNRKGLTSLWVDKNCIKDFSSLEELQERGTYVGGINEQLESCERKITTLGKGE